MRVDVHALLMLDDTGKRPNELLAVLPEHWAVLPASAVLS